MGLKIQRALWVPSLAVWLAGCHGGQDQLQLRDLDRAERLYVERFVTLERARAVALVDLAAGTALLDSLGRAWGDTSPTRVLADLPQNPGRLAALHELLERVLEAEGDSLLKSPVPSRLAAPLPPLSSGR